MEHARRERVDALEPGIRGHFVVLESDAIVARLVQRMVASSDRGPNLRLHATADPHDFERVVRGLAGDALPLIACYLSDCFPPGPKGRSSKGQDLLRWLRALPPSAAAGGLPLNATPVLAKHSFVGFDNAATDARALTIRSPFRREDLLSALEWAATQTSTVATTAE